MEGRSRQKLDFIKQDYIYQVIVAEFLDDLVLDDQGRFDHVVKDRPTRVIFCCSQEAAAIVAYSAIAVSASAAVIMLDFSKDHQSSKYMSCLGYLYRHEKSTTEDCVVGFAVSWPIKLIIMESFPGPWKHNVLPDIRKEMIKEAALDLDPTVNKAQSL